jgi:mannose-6-phosphate isomerase
MIFFFNIIPISKIWGGINLSSLYGLNYNGIGEVWGISGHKSSSNSIKSEYLKGKTLAYLFDNHLDLFGNLPLCEFPILIKLIDAGDDLSIQVHPNNNYAYANEKSLGKEECWYVLDSYKSSKVIVGHKALSREEFEFYIEKGEVEKILNYYPIKKDDFFYIPSGTIHAICKDTFILEVSQSSDITYRLHDFNRIDNGKPRDLHIDKALSVMKFPDTNITKTIEKNFFDFIILTEPQERTANVYGDYFYIIEGMGTINENNFNMGDFIMVSSLEKYLLMGNFKLALINIILSEDI